MWHFEIYNHIIYADNNLKGPWNRREVWGMYVGRWVLDYTWKLSFGISENDWNNRCSNIKTDEDFYDFCNWLGVRYKYIDGQIYHKGLIVK